ncbi:hypothetical protein F5J12DRAFT_548751 [Pisolithus orientalis]|uniref:uncharacterized protein n=1 Tax=Pisolithus orientalis TaxID=936130 RepID=UPI002224D2FF|nr:uncharacterized protein F5J12DRAFT_548751 [Pisolithus orientalis]KAI6012731.1 hypothetical protein F5J12DRAFT_548751 [Pisolithus orientalis]
MPVPFELCSAITLGPRVLACDVRISGSDTGMSPASRRMIEGHLALAMMRGHPALRHIEIILRWSSTVVELTQGLPRFTDVSTRPIPSLRARSWHTGRCHGIGAHGNLCNMQCEVLLPCCWHLSPDLVLLSSYTAPSTFPVPIIYQVSCLFRSAPTRKIEQLSREAKNSRHMIHI